MASGVENEWEKPEEGLLWDHHSSAPSHKTTEHRLHAADHIRSLTLTRAFGLFRPAAAPLTSRLPSSATRHITFKILPLPKLRSLCFPQFHSPAVISPLLSNLCFLLWPWIRSLCECPSAHEKNMFLSRMFYNIFKVKMVGNIIQVF